jgi:hypothetical protein
MVRFDLSAGMSQKATESAKAPPLPTMPKHEDRPYASHEDIRTVDLMSPLAKKGDLSVAGKSGTRSKGWEVKGPVITRSTENALPAKAKPPSKPVKP